MYLADSHKMLMRHRLIFGVDVHPEGDYSLVSKMFLLQDVCETTHRMVLARLLTAQVAKVTSH